MKYNIGSSKPQAPQSATSKGMHHKLWREESSKTILLGGPPFAVASSHRRFDLSAILNKNYFSGGWSCQGRMPQKISDPEKGSMQNAGCPRVVRPTTAIPCGQCCLTMLAPPIRFFPQKALCKCDKLCHRAALTHVVERGVVATFYKLPWTKWPTKMALCHILFLQDLVILVWDRVATAGLG